MTLLKPNFSFLSSKKSSQYLPFLGLLAITVFIFSLYLLLRNQQPPSPTALPNPTPQSTNNNNTTPTLGMKLVSITPTSNTIESLLSVKPITFTFNLPISKSTINYTITPPVPSRAVFNPQTPRQFTVVPTQGWVANQSYTITISANLSSTTNQQITKPVGHTFKLTRPNPDEYPFIRE